MSDIQPWNDASREELRESIRSVIRGELRLAKRDTEDILESCREGYIQEESPESEWDAFTQFASDELDRISAQLNAERATWPAVTDCDRLDRVEAALRDRGILFWQASSCCDTCTGAELPDRIDAINSRYPGFREKLQGYAFFIDQNLPESLAEGTDIAVFLGYGWLSTDDSEVSEEVYAKNALGIAHQVCDCMREEGLTPDWNGDFARKIGLGVTWHRRSMLE